ncbi:DegQ family serine endoprotease [Myxococcota bacterium]|nr:DegQ family serine endoprotease [Myxococcota bacterium]
MKHQGLFPASILGAAIATLILVAGGPDTELDWRTAEANAIDLWGSDDDKEESEGKFWTENADTPPGATINAPASFADLAERVSPGVVNIKTSKTVTNRQMPPVFEDFFFGPYHGERGGPEREVPSLGSGFVISSDGYIATNNHVIADVDSITVVFDDGREFEATVVGRDPKTDIALIQVETEEELFSLPLGDSDSVRPGEWVVAIGNPYGLAHTVTAGIVSAKHRDLQGSYDDYIQTDAAINPGNSGGPLLNLSGEVIGINTLINPRANTIGFAVPVNMAKDVLPQLRGKGHVTRGWLGVMIQPIQPEFQEHLKLDSDAGALVSDVLEDGPALRAGIEKGDVIIQFDGVAIKEMKDLPQLVAQTPVGKKVQVVVLRDGKRKTLTTKIAEMDDDGPKAAKEPEESSTTEFGLRVQELTPELADQLNLDSKQGVLVAAVEPGSAAGEAGIRRGDVILEVNRKAVNDTEALSDELSNVDASALLLIKRGEATLFVALKRE